MGHLHRVKKFRCARIMSTEKNSLVDHDYKDFFLLKPSRSARGFISNIFIVKRLITRQEAEDRVL